MRSPRFDPKPNATGVRAWGDCPESLWGNICRPDRVGSSGTGVNLPWKGLLRAQSSSRRSRAGSRLRPFQPTTSVGLGPSAVLGLALVLGMAASVAAQALDPRLIRARCEAVHQVEDQSVLYGFVVDGETDIPLPGSTVRLSWVEVSGASDSTLHGAEADATDGAYIFCDVPQRTRIAAQGGALGQLGRPVELWFEGGELERHDLPVVVTRERGGLAGRVIDATTGRPIEAATIDLPNADARTVSDADGYFRIDDVAVGSFEATVHHVAYGDPKFQVEIQDRRTAYAELRLTPAPVTVEPISVTIRYRAQWLERTGFYDRLASHLGEFVTPEEMETHRWRRFSEILRNVPGVEITQICTPHCSQILRMSTTTQSRCIPTFFVDGRRMMFRERVMDLDAIAPANDLEAMEVYRGIAQTPPQFYGRCGSVVIWTRRGAG